MPPTEHQAPDGLYILANDRVLNWAIAFLESVRAHEPDLRLVMIPFNDQFDALAALRDRYRFEIFQDPSLLQLDEIGKRFFPNWEMPTHTFRKFAVFWGPLEQFVFSDVDIVHLSGVREHINAYARSGFDLLHTDEEIHQVYAGMELRQRMIDEYGAHGFNTGFWAARRGLFSLERIEQLASEALPIAAEFNQGTYEQPFFNYCCDVSRLRYKHLADVIPDLTHKFLAGQRGIIRSPDGAYRIKDPASPENGKRITFLHWAGTPASAVMPYRSIFLHYRMRSESPMKRLWMHIAGLPRATAWKAVAWVRNTGWASRAYKRLMPGRLQQRVSAKLAEK